MNKRLCGFLLLLIVAAGCASGPFARRDEIPVQSASADQIITYLNQNAAAVHSMQCDNVSIRAKQGLQMVSVDGYLAFQKPRNFRLIAEAVGSQQADMGSNDREFWFWIKKADPPDLYHCSYEDLPNSRRLGIPIHPDWVAEALGVTELGSADQYRVETKGKLIELVSQTTSPQGQPMRKVTAIDPTTRRIVRHDLIGANGKPIWTAYVEEYQPAKVAGQYAIPRKVRLVCPAEKMEMHLKLDGCRINPLNENNVHPQMFARPQVRGVRTVDLAGGPPTATPQGRVRGNAD